MRGAVLPIFILGVCSLCLAQKVSFTPASKADVLYQTQDPPASARQRAARLKTLFTASGCGQAWLSEQKLSEQMLSEQNPGPQKTADGQESSDAVAPNVICRLPGETGRTIIVGAHYENAASAPHLFDNWRAAALLPSLFASLRPRLRHHTIVFVAFAGHGNQPAGAEFYVARLGQAELGHVDAMVNLDALGFSPTKVWTSHSDKDLVHALVVTMYMLRLPASQIDIEAAGATESQPFAARNIPQITIHSMTQAHLVGEIPWQFRPDNFYDTYRLLCGYLAFLDQSLKPRARPE